ncbi:hypothetical protein AB0N28_01535 [Streptomyces sp. NPDC051130]|uniref:hypothetical protein n=1 Tax=Streptomyces sp. NPDC051130 TaxID=3157223 RepID=UPI00341E8A11
MVTARTRSRIVAPLASVGMLPLLVYALRPGVVGVLVALSAAGLAHAYTLGLDRMYLDAVPEELRGRAMTLLSTGLMTLQGAGMALAGLASEFWPVHLVVAGSGVLGTAVVLLLLAELRAAAEPVRGPKRETGLTAK